MVIVPWKSNNNKIIIFVSLSPSEIAADVKFDGIFGVNKKDKNNEATAESAATHRQIHFNFAPINRINDLWGVLWQSC